MIIWLGQWQDTKTLHPGRQKIDNLSGNMPIVNIFMNISQLLIYFVLTDRDANDPSKLHWFLL